MGNVCSSEAVEEHDSTRKHLEFPPNIEILGDYNVFDEFPLDTLDTLTEDLLKRGSSFRVKPKSLKSLKSFKTLKSLKSLKRLETPSSMPQLSSRWGSRNTTHGFFKLDEDREACEDSDSKSVVSDVCEDSDSKSVVSFKGFESMTFESMTSLSNVSEDDSTKFNLDSVERRSTKYDMNNWVWKPEDDSRICRTSSRTMDSPPGIPRLSRRSPGPGQRFPSKYP